MFGNKTKTSNLTFDLMQIYKKPPGGDFTRLKRYFETRIYISWNEWKLSYFKNMKEYLICASNLLISFKKNNMETERKLNFYE